MAVAKQDLTSRLSNKISIAKRKRPKINKVIGHRQLQAKDLPKKINFHNFVRKSSSVPHATVTVCNLFFMPILKEERAVCVYIFTSTAFIRLDTNDSLSAYLTKGCVGGRGVTRRVRSLSALQCQNYAWSSTGTFKIGPLVKCDPKFFSGQKKIFWIKNFNGRARNNLKVQLF